MLGQARQGNYIQLWYSPHSQKHHLHHENITTTETVRVAITTEIQLYAFIIYVVNN